MVMNQIFHITQRKQWEKAKSTGTYCGDTLESEGFIHCSMRSQVLGVANRFFRNQKNLILLCIDPDKVKPEIRYEVAEGEERYPHIYGALNIDAVSEIIDFEADKDGLFKLPLNIQNLS